LSGVIKEGAKSASGLEIRKYVLGNRREPIIINKFSWFRKKIWT
jgi:hypothetical protein